MMNNWIYDYELQSYSLRIFEPHSHVGHTFLSGVSILFVLIVFFDIVIQFAICSADYAGKTIEGQTIVKSKHRK
jgi:hypothetical protein